MFIIKEKRNNLERVDFKIYKIKYQNFNPLNKYLEFKKKSKIKIIN